MSITDTEVVIIGGGPAGLMLAIELGCRSVPCVLLEEDVAPPDFPKANATSSRTMEHYRRRGFAHVVRNVGLPDDHPTDVRYYTRLAQHELARFEMPSRTQAIQWRDEGDRTRADWATPELPHRAQQMYIEPILRDQLRRYPSVDLRVGRRALSVVDRGADVIVEHVNPDGGDPQSLRSRYVVGCDGPRSLVRRAMDVTYDGIGNEQRDFMGGQMLSIYFRSRDLYDVMGGRKAWQYWALNRSQRGVLNAINGVDEFLLAVQLATGEDPAHVDCRKAVLEVVGAGHDFELIAAGPWQAGYTLVAKAFSKGRLFIAGDAAHLFTPTAGMGYNTSVDDAVNLGWKLALVAGGSAPPALLDTYEAERHPIALRNTTFARSMADSIGRIEIPDDIELDAPSGRVAREKCGERLARHAAAEYHIPGLQLGLLYEGSPIVAQEDAPPMPDDPNVYVPTARPGARAPHVSIDGTPLFDQLGRDFTLVACGPVDADGWRHAARERNLDLAILTLANPLVRELYGADCILIRPDHHIAWRGAADQSPAHILDLARGAMLPNAMVGLTPEAARTDTASVSR
ncbi:FAD-dependent monooxygenase [Paraburkholderia fungorum]